MEQIQETLDMGMKDIRMDVTAYRIEACNVASDRGKSLEMITDTDEFVANELDNVSDPEDREWIKNTLNLQYLSKPFEKEQILQILAQAFFMK